MGKSEAVFSLCAITESISSISISISPKWAEKESLPFTSLIFYL
jgi:hypothetical protein